MKKETLTSFKISHIKVIDVAWILPFGACGVVWYKMLVVA